MADIVWTSTSSTDVSAAGNYAGGAPVTGSNLILNGVGTASLTTAINTYPTNLLGLTLNATDAFTADIGLEASGTNNATFFKLGASGTNNAYIGRNMGGDVGNGSSLMLLDFNTATSNVFVYKTGSKSGAYPCLCIKGTQVALNVFSGELGFAIRPTDTGTLTALSMLDDDDFTPPVVRCGSGTTFPSTVRVDRGTLYSHSTHAMTALKVVGSEATVETEADSTGAVTYPDLYDGATLIHKGTGAITAATVRASCTLDLSHDAQSKTLDAVQAFAGSTINLDNGNASSITHSAGGTNVPVITCPDGPNTVTIHAPAGMALKIQ
jgi:hypothetical protein